MTTNSLSAPALKIPPAMPGLPLLGNTLAFLNRGGMPVETFRRVAQKQGDVVHLRAASRTIVSRFRPSHLQNAKIIPLRQGTTFPKDGMPMAIHSRNPFAQA